MSLFQVIENVDVENISVDTSQQGQRHGCEGGDLSWRQLFIQISQKMTCLGQVKEEGQSGQGGESVQDVRGARLEKKLHHWPQVDLKSLLSPQVSRRTLTSPRSTRAALRRTQESVAMLRQIVGLIVTEVQTVALLVLTTFLGPILVFWSLMCQDRLLTGASV